MKKDIGEETSMITLRNTLLEKVERIFTKINHAEGLIQVTEHKENYCLAVQDYQRASDCYEKVLKFRSQSYHELHPDLGKSYFALATVYEFNQRYSNAIKYYDLAIK